MNTLQNLHTHTSFCDGRDTPEELALTAAEKGFGALGFSGHSYMFFAQEHSMSLSGTQAYKAELARLRRLYEGRLEIYCGLEVELHSQVDLSGYDYLIGSAHYFNFDGTYVGFDRDAESVRQVIDRHFGGDGMRYARAYYELLVTLPEHGSFDILGHFDLIAKHAEHSDFFDIGDKTYLGYAFDAIDALQGKIPYFEVNTGAIARGYRTAPYPSIPILKRLLECGFMPLVSSDCHDRRCLDCAFDDAAALLEHCGAKEKIILTKAGFVPAALR